MTATREPRDVERYELLRGQALAGAPSGFRLGLALLEHRGVTVWTRAWQSTTPGPARRRSRPAPVDCRRPREELVSALASMALACARQREQQPIRRRTSVMSALRDGAEGHRRASRAYRVPVCAPVDAAPGPREHRVDAAAIRAAATRDPARLAGRADRRDRHRPGAVRRERRTARGSSDSSPTSAWGRPGSCSASRSPGSRATTPTGTGCWRSARCRGR